MAARSLGMVWVQGDGEGLILVRVVYVSKIASQHAAVIEGQVNSSLNILTNQKH